MRLTADWPANLAAALPPPLQFLIAAACPEQQVEMTRADWDDVPAAALRHGLSGCLQTAVTHANAPAAIREHAALAARQNAIDGLKGIAEVIEISRVLREAGVASVCLKGPTLSRWLYETAAFRRFSDLDIMVSPRDVRAVHEALAPHGYRLPDSMTLRTARAIYQGLGALPLKRARWYPLDVHFRLCHVSFGSPLKTHDVIAESRELDDVAGVRIPSATHAALMLLVHASKHLWCTLEMLLAIARVMQRRDVDWVRVRALARRSGTWNGCTTGLVLASALFRVTLPEEISEHGHLRAPDDLLGAACAAWLRPAGSFADRWEERRSHRAALDGWSDRLRYDVYRLTSPTPLEPAWCELPDSLTFLYPPVRLMRLTLTAARAARHRALSRDSSDSRDRAPA
jgi:putative nucleotidyltransferase-like protein